jgi:hypothetical protein
MGAHLAGCSACEEDYVSLRLLAGGWSTSDPYFRDQRH